MLEAVRTILPPRAYSTAPEMLPVFLTSSVWKWNTNVDSLYVRPVRLLTESIATRSVYHAFPGNGFRGMSANDPAPVQRERAGTSFFMLSVSTAPPGSENGITGSLNNTSITGFRGRPRALSFMSRRAIEGLSVSGVSVPSNVAPRASLSIRFPARSSAPRTVSR